VELNIIKPADISKFITFKEDDKNWNYDETKREMNSYQAEGVAGILNRLEKYKMAILADEVGMGKTYQALGALFYYKFNQYKDKKFKVLIISPRKEVMTQWKGEYETFKQHHLKDEPMDLKIEELKSFKNVTIEADVDIVFAQTNSFSSNLDIKKLYESFESFNFFIIDEAHKYRQDAKDKARTLRTRNAKDLFDKISDRNRAKILLLTATPLHSTKEDLKHIIKVFNRNISSDSIIGKDSQSIMKHLMIRRLRILDKYNKYQYREEKELAVEMASKDTDFKDELFFAMLQKQLIKEYNKGNDLNRSKNLLDLLEGTVFDEQYADKETKENIDKIAKKILEKFQKVYGKKSFPSNQKYNKIINKITQNDEKSLIFVRRRASAIEIVRQYIDNFDKKWWKYLTGNDSYPSQRVKFDEALGFKISQTKLDNFNDRKYIQDKIRTKKERKFRAIEFYMQFNDLTQDNFEEFWKNIDNSDVDENDEMQIALPKSSMLSFFKPKKGEIETSAYRFVKKFKKTKGYNTFFEDWLPKKLYKNNKELYVKYMKNQKTIKSAVIHASVGMIELFKYEVFADFKYDSFIAVVGKSENFNKFEFTKQITEFLTHIPSYEKAMKLNQSANDDVKYKKDSQGRKLEKNDEKKFYNSQPAYAYLANSKNENVLARFNSPFFPNVLCGTSTLEEGLNLHVHCNKIYHFSAAHTMGSDEQRIGRVDRLHGKMHRELEESSEKKLDIYYSYLKNTFDEENLRNMLCKKRYTEKEIDVCKQAANFDKNPVAIVCEKEIESLLQKTNANTAYDAEPFGWEMIDD
jgi:superfamily II DNA or RNA helicase